MKKWNDDGVLLCGRTACDAIATSGKNPYHEDDRYCDKCARLINRHAEWEMVPLDPNSKATIEERRLRWIEVPPTPLPPREAEHQARLEEARREILEAMRRPSPTTPRPGAPSLVEKPARKACPCSDSAVELDLCPHAPKDSRRRLMHIERTEWPNPEQYEPMGVFAEAVRCEEQPGFGIQILWTGPSLLRPCLILWIWTLRVQIGWTALDQIQDPPIPDCACGHLWAHHHGGGEHCNMCGCLAYTTQGGPDDGRYIRCGDCGWTGTERETRGLVICECPDCKSTNMAVAPATQGGQKDAPCGTCDHAEGCDFKEGDWCPIPWPSPTTQPEQKP